MLVKTPQVQNCPDQQSKCPFHFVYNRMLCVGSFSGAILATFTQLLSKLPGSRISLSSLLFYLSKLNLKKLMRACSKWKVYIFFSHFNLVRRTNTHSNPPGQNNRKQSTLPGQKKVMGRSYQWTWPIAGFALHATVGVKHKPTSKTCSSTKRKHAKHFHRFASTSGKPG